MPYEGKRKQVLDQLLARTTEKKLKWNIDAEELSYSVVLKSAHLVRAAWPEDTAYVYIFNRDGTELFRYSENISEAGNGVSLLWAAAKDSALGIDDAIEQILQDLN